MIILLQALFQVIRIDSYKVLKFGGSSLKSYKEIKNVADIIIQSQKRNESPIIVCSACGDSTNKLINLKSKIDFENFKKYHYDIIKELNILEINNTKEKYKDLMHKLYKKKFLNNDIKDERYRDDIISFGERLSTMIVSNYLNKLGIKSKYYNSYDLGFITDNNFGNAKLLDDSEGKIKKNILAITNDYIPIITGFIGKSKNNEITTLGRGGSDLTATIIGKCINAKEVQVWKDVDGIYTCDPKLIKESKLMHQINYNEALEMAKNGAKILHPQALEPCIEKNIAVIVKNSYNIKAKGTIINNNKRLITALTYQKNVAVIQIYSKKNMLKMLKMLKNKNIEFQELYISKEELCISINEVDLYKLNDINEKMKIKSNVSSITIINSNNQKRINNILLNICEDLEKNDINIYFKNNMTLILESKHLLKCLKMIHNYVI